MPANLSALDGGEFHKWGNGSDPAWLQVSMDGILYMQVR